MTLPSRFLITMYEVDTTAEVYLEPFQAYIGLSSFEIFNSLRKKASS